MGKPAARVTDMHTCPMVTPGLPPVPHVGGPILPAGVPTVLIGGLPAATVGSMCTCVGPPDAIVLGSMGVFFGGRPAARMGDMTAHGGVVVGGLPTVLVGDMMPGMMAMLVPCDILNRLAQTPATEEAKQEQARLQQDLMNCVNQQLDGMSPEQRAATMQALNQYQRTSNALDDARLSQAVYDGSTPPGFERVDPTQFGIDPSYMNDTGEGGSGFKAAIYRSTTGRQPEHILVFAGTENESGDIISDARQGVGMQDEQYDRAMFVGNQMSVGLGGSQNFSTTGHSLGGGLASSVSATTGARGTTFNAAGLHENTTSRGDFAVSESTRESRMANVDAYYASDDPLNYAQDNRGWVLPAALGVGGGIVGGLIGGVAGFFTGGFVGAGLGALAGGSLGARLGLAGSAAVLATGGVPTAYGNRIELPTDVGFANGHQIATVVALLEERLANDLDALRRLFNCG